MYVPVDAVGDRARSAGVDLAEAGQARLAAYLAALLEVGRGLNLTAARDADAALKVLLGPSLAVQAAWPPDRPPVFALDLGSGNGFPGVVVAARWPTARVLLVERRAKKANAIADCADRAGMRNVEVLALDARELPRQRPDLAGALDLVTVRAVGPLGRATRMAAGLIAPGGRVIHWKTQDLDAAERDEGARVARAAGLVVLADVPGTAPGSVLVPYERPGEGG
jgi:16S rRNA (guanine527-N7)-methyltransferase